MGLAASTFSGKQVAVFGLGRSGISVAHALMAGGAEVVAHDDNATSLDRAKAAGITIGDLRNVDFAGLDALVLSPGVPLTHPAPHWTVERAIAAGIEVIGDTEVFVREIAGSGARVVAITGTNGKSTTTALIGHVLGHAGRDVAVGGNIGTAVFDLEPPREGLIYVLEFSSYQLDLTPSLKADVAILLNLSPDHLDRHGDMDNYARVKAKIFAGQAAGGVAVIGVDDDWSRAIAEEIAGAQTVSVRENNAATISVAGGVLGDGDEHHDLRGFVHLQGAHNWQNAAAAWCAGRALGLAGEDILAGFESFGGLVHRMEIVGHIGPVTFVNDSKGTNADAAARALATFDPIYWIAGGLAKDGGIEGLAPYFGRIAKAYLIGEAAEDFAATLDGKVPVEMCGTLDVAVARAAGDAMNAPGKGQRYVLLSPACASFDQFESFDKRGDAFRDAVKALDGFEQNAGAAAA